jgi:chorismate lyase
MIIQIANLFHVKLCPPKNLSVWLSHRASLTEKLKRESGEAELQVLNQTWNQPNWWDKFTLELGITPVLHRDVLMFSHQLPVWFARTIIPLYCYEANKQIFNRLRNESLGGIVFNEPTFERVHLLNYAIDENCLEYQWLPDALKASKQPLWLRLSTFTNVGELKFYLVEILLPGLLQVC